MNKITVMKQLDALLGPVLVLAAKLIHVPKAQGSGSPRRVLFIRPGGMGDAILLIPAIQAVKRKLTGVIIDVLAEARNSEVFALCPDVNRVYHYGRPQELWTAIRGRYHVIIDTEQWHRLSAVVSRLGRAHLSIGFATNERSKLFSHRVPYSHDDYEVHSFLPLIAPIVGTEAFDPEPPFIPVPDRDRESVKQYFEPFESKKIIAFFPGGSIPERQWGGERFHAVAELLSRMAYGIVVIGGEGDRQAGEAIVRGIPSGLNLCGRLSLSGSAAVLERASLLITGDSGIMHLGYAVGTRVLALFGPGIEKKWAPRSPRVAILNKHLPCSPCTKYGYTPKCPRDTACMKGISAEDVINSAIALLDKD